jgi:hypothetical protein
MALVLITPIPESAPLNPINPYGFTKVVCERMMDDFALAHGIRSARLRYFNAAGADPACEIGEHHDPETHLIPLILDAAAGLARPFRCSARTIRRRMAPPSATMCMCRICPRACLGIAIFVRWLRCLAVNLGSGQGSQSLQAEKKQAHGRYQFQPTIIAINIRIPSYSKLTRSGLA